MRFAPHTGEERQEMLAAIGLKTVSDLFSDVPEAVRFRGDLDVPPGLSELDLERLLRDISRENTSLDDCISFLGAGVYDRFVPAAVGEIVRRSEFYTSYTPYQPEISQGTLQVIYEFQSLICRLTGLEVSQASLYDGATAAAEAAMLSAGEKKIARVLVAGSLDPQYRRVIRTYARGQGIAVEEVGMTASGLVDPEALAEALEGGAAAFIAGQPNFLGLIEPMEQLCELTHRHGALFVAVADPVALSLLQPPGAWGADIAVGEGQSLGLAPSFGGPYLGFMAARQALVRRLPGRIAGATQDGEGRRGYVLTLQTREQHIRRERATSNICTNQGLCALTATVYLSLMGRAGMRSVASLSLEGAHRLAQRVASLPGVRMPFEGPFFQEFVAVFPKPAGDINRELEKVGIIGGLPLVPWYPELGPGAMLIAVTEKRTAEDLDRLVNALEAML